MKSIFGLNERIVAPISYFGLCLTGLLVYVFEKENRFVRFHALQSTVTFGLLAVLGVLQDVLLNLVAIIPVIGWLLVSILGVVVWVLNILIFALWIYLMYSSWQGKTFRVPIIGDIVWKKVNS